MRIFPERLTPNQLMLLLKQELVALFTQDCVKELKSPELQLPVYAYVVNENVVFYPGSDFDLPNRSSKPENPIHLQHIIAVFEEQQKNDNTLKAKTLYFPITEEREGRVHFVFIKLDLGNTSSYLIDSKAPKGFHLFYFFGPRIWDYSIAPIERIIQERFKASTTLQHIESQSFFDTNSCGYHVCASIILLLKGEFCAEKTVKEKVVELQKKGVPQSEEESQILSVSCMRADWEMLDIIAPLATTNTDPEAWTHVDEAGNEIKESGTATYRM